MVNKKYAVVKVNSKTLARGSGVSLREAENAFQKGFMDAARKKKDTKYKGRKGIIFENY